MATPLSIRDKTDILNNLANIPVLLESVAARQNSGPDAPANVDDDDLTEG